MIPSVSQRFPKGVFLQEGREGIRGYRSVALHMYKYIYIYIGICKSMVVSMKPEHQQLRMEKTKPVSVCVGDHIYICIYLYHRPTHSEFSIVWRTTH